MLTIPSKIIRELPRHLKDWLPVVSFFSLLICYVVGYLSWKIYFGQFHLDIGDFFALTDYAVLPINRPWLFAFFVVALITPATLLLRSEEEAKKDVRKPLSIILGYLGMVLCTLGLTAGIAYGDALRVIDGHSAAFDVYTTDNSKPIERCGFIAATAKFYFCYDYATKTPLVINTQVIEKLVLVKAETKYECKENDCDYPP